MSGSACAGAQGIQGIPDLIAYESTLEKDVVPAACAVPACRQHRVCGRRDQRTDLRVYLDGCSAAARISTNGKIYLSMESVSDFYSLASSAVFKERGS